MSLMIFLAIVVMLIVLGMYFSGSSKKVERESGTVEEICQRKGILLDDLDKKIEKAYDYNPHKYPEQTTGKKVNAIKSVVDETNASLAEAKLYVDRWVESYNPFSS